MGLGKCLKKASQGVGKFFGDLSQKVVKKVADFAAPIAKKVGEYARPVADAVSGVAMVFGQPEIAALAQGAGRAVEKWAHKAEDWSGMAQDATKAFGNKMASKVQQWGDQVKADAQGKTKLVDFLQ